MVQFIQANFESFDRMFNQAAGSCTVFRNQSLPGDCSPNHADIGLERNAATGKIIVYVSNGINYSGQDESLSRWISEGLVTFDSIRELLDWLKGPVAAAMNFSASQEQTPIPGNRIRSIDAYERIGGITDMEVVRSRLEEQSGSSVLIDAKQLQAELEKHVKGQSTAVQTISREVSRHLLKKRNSEPLTLFAIGPPGVGKTLAGERLYKALKQVSGNTLDYSFLRLDMNQYAEEHRVSQLLGSPQGYIGYGDGAELSDALRKNPRMVIVFDEIEKAHPKILQVLMNLFNAGRLTVPQGNSGNYEISCTEAIFYFTSNLLNEQVYKELETRHALEDCEAIDAICRANINMSGWKREIVDRMNRFIYFTPLQPLYMAEIIENEILRTFLDYGMEVVSIDPEVVLSILHHTRSSHSARRYAKHIERMFENEIFRAAAEQRVVRVKVLGPEPYRIEPAEAIMEEQV